MTTLIRELPWLLPGTVLSLAVAIVAAGPVGRWLGLPRVVAGLLVLNVGVILVATLSPLGSCCPPEVGQTGTCDLSRVGPAPLRALWPPSDVTGNIIGFVPLGFAIGLARRRRRALAVLCAALVLPFVIEATQLIVLDLRRACESADIVDNLTGVMLGVAAGAVVAAVRAGRIVSQ